MSGSSTLHEHEDRVRYCLELLGFRPHGELHLEPLRDGRSGAFTYRIRSGNEALILKIVLADSHPLVVERGRREALFYSLLGGVVPLAVPEVVATYGPVRDAAEQDGSRNNAAPVGTALLLRAYRSPQPVAAWAQSQYEEVARQLAGLHALYWGKTDKLEKHDWLRRSSDDFSRFKEGAHSSWRGLWSQERLAAVFDAPVISRIERALEELTSQSTSSVPAAPESTAETTSVRKSDRRSACQSAFDASRSFGLPLMLCHGDAHHENLLVRDDGALVWSDWQEVGIGYGPDDVSFFYQRAVAAGGKVDWAAMLRAYHAELERLTGETIDLSALRRRAAFYEATTRLYHWPAYLQQAPESVVRAHVSRVMDLLSELDSVGG